MTMPTVESVCDRDSLHILPLEIVPLATPSLRRARLIKNVRLEGMVELFRDKSSGSGQIEPDELHLVFDLNAMTKGDIEIVKQLSKLPSYDVYSLRVSLRQIGIEVDEDQNLRLSPQMEAEVAVHMKEFTRPLIAKIYGGERSQDGGLSDLLGLFISPDVSSARENLRRIADALDIELLDIPKFLSDYADVYLSLSYYEHCRGSLAPGLESFKGALVDLRQDPAIRGQSGSLAQFDFVEKKLTGIYSDIGHVIEMFKVHTENMWEDISRERYREMEDLIFRFQTRIGAGLCAAQVKVDGWMQRFPTRTSGNPIDRAGFITREMVHGLDKVESVAYADV